MKRPQVILIADNGHITVLYWRDVGKFLATSMEEKEILLQKLNLTNLKQATFLPLLTMLIY